MSAAGALLALGAAVLGVTLELLRRRSLREELAWLWLLIGAALLGSGWLSVGEVPPTHADLVGLRRWVLGLAVGGVAVGLLVSVHLSSQSRRIQALTQQLALLEEKLRRAREGG